MVVVPWAEVTRLSVISARDIGPFRGRSYREIEATMEGSRPGDATRFQSS